MPNEALGHMSFGWGAPPIREQAPMLSPADATAFQTDADTLIRLHVRGVLSDGERNRAITRLHKAIAGAARIRSAIQGGENAE